VTNIIFEPVTEEHIKFISDTMREGDRAEVYASGYRSTYTALKHSVDGSLYSSTALDEEGTPLVMFGMGTPTMLNGFAKIWMLGSKESERYIREFLVETREVFKEMFNYANVLYNYVHIDNKKSIRWLRHLGAVFDEPITIGGHKFMKFKVYK